MSSELISPWTAPGGTVVIPESLPRVTSTRVPARHPASNSTILASLRQRADAIRHASEGDWRMRHVRRLLSDAQRDIESSRPDFWVTNQLRLASRHLSELEGQVTA